MLFNDIPPSASPTLQCSQYKIPPIFVAPMDSETMGTGNSIEIAAIAQYLKTVTCRQPACTLRQETNKMLTGSRRVPAYVLLISL